MSMSTLKKRPSEGQPQSPAKKPKGQASKLCVEFVQDDSAPFFTEIEFVERMPADRVKILMRVNPDRGGFILEEANAIAMAQRKLRFATKTTTSTTTTVDGDPTMTISTTYRFSGNLQPDARSELVADRGVQALAASVGRVYPVRMASFGELKSTIRNFLGHGIWTGLDFANCHPTILVAVVKAFNTTVPDQDKVGVGKLEKYCNKRDETLASIMEHCNVDRSSAKTLVLSTLNGGTYTAWLKKADPTGCLDHTAQFTPPKCIPELQAEVKAIRDLVCSHNEHLRVLLKPNEKQVEKVTKQKKARGRPRKSDAGPLPTDEKPILASDDQVLSYFTQEHERRMLKALFEFLVRKEVILLAQGKYEAMLRYDGVDFPVHGRWSKLTEAEKEELLVEASEYICERTGIRVGVTEKPYEKSELEDRLRQAAAAKADAAFDHKHLIELKDNYEQQKAYFEQYAGKNMRDASFYVRWPHTGVATYDERKLKAAFKHVQTKVSKDLETSFIDTWLADTELRCVQGLIVRPGRVATQPGDSESEFINSFPGHPTFKSDERHAASTVCAFLDAFHFIGLQLCENDPLKYQFLFNVMANQLQQPHKRPGKGFVFQNKKQGIGADVWFGRIGAVLGQRNYANSSNVDDFFGTHATGLNGKLLVVMNELEFKNAKALQSYLKSAITDASIIVNPKHVTPFKVDLFCVIVFVSNKPNAISMDVSSGERRFVLFQATDVSKATFNGLWGDLCSVFETDTFLDALSREMDGVDLQDFDADRWRNATLSEAYFKASAFNACLPARFFALVLFDDETFETVAKDAVQQKTKPGDGAKSDEKDEDSMPWHMTRPQAPAALKSRPSKVTIKRSALLDLYKLFRQEHVGDGSFRKKEFTDFVETILKPNDVITQRKSGEVVYDLYLFKLWAVLAENRWVEQAYEVHRKEFKDTIEEQLRTVNTRFNRLALTEASDIRRTTEDALAAWKQEQNK